MPEVRRCKEYIEDRMSELIPQGALEQSSGDFKVLSIKDVDTFHRIAQSLGIKEILKKRNIHYYITLPDSSEWAIILSYNIPQFEKQYGSMYKITKVTDRPIYLEGQ